MLNDAYDTYSYQLSIINCVLGSQHLMLRLYRSLAAGVVVLNFSGS
uniref:Uncharacterized protein n=1 Tax=Anguilla anguilla TaxID=7936 RepID=A0A0E9VAL2_ANGAN